ncbi:MAG: hypothetical protein R3E01_25560 [Pirellulaceae bacterium]|nr:hypothetical protein [Planctomycetales bacterium]
MDKHRLIKPILTIVLLALVGSTNVLPVRIDSAIRQASTKHYTKIQGTVLKVIWPAGNVPGTIQYEYVVNGQRYLSDRFAHATLFDDEEFRNAMASARVDEPIDVYYDPLAPEECVLHAGPTMACGIALSFAVCIAICAGVIANLLGRELRTREKIRARIDRQSENLSECHHRGLRRLRLVPIATSPILVGILSFATYAVIGFVVAIALDYAFDLWRFRLDIATGGALLAGIVAGVFDLQHTVRGNRRGRWDLVIDRDAGYLQLPAVGAWGEPTIIRTESVTNLSIERLHPPDRETREIVTPYKLMITVEDNGGEFQHRVSSMTNRRELEVLAEWIGESIGFDLATQSIPSTSDSASTSLTLA